MTKDNTPPTNKEIYFVKKTDDINELLSKMASGKILAMPEISIVTLEDAKKMVEKEKKQLLQTIKECLPEVKIHPSRNTKYDMPTIYRKEFLSNLQSKGINLN